MTPISEMTNKKKKCYKCNGTGIASEIRVDGTQTCPVCDGTGYIMKPISEMTNAELDKLIAEKRGWKVVSVTSAFSLSVTKDVWINPSGYAENSPSFTTDPRYAMELLEEMPNPQITKDIDFWRVVPDVDSDMEHYVIGDNIDLKRAIAEAYAEWRGR